MLKLMVTMHCTCTLDGVILFSEHGTGSLAQATLPLLASELTELSISLCPGNAIGD